jgi:hypothetical protein
MARDGSLGTTAFPEAGELVLGATARRAEACPGARTYDIGYRGISNMSRKIPVNRFQ